MNPTKPLPVYRGLVKVRFSPDDKVRLQGNGLTAAQVQSLERWLPSILDMICWASHEETKTELAELVDHLSAASRCILRWRQDGSQSAGMAALGALNGVPAEENPGDREWPHYQVAGDLIELVAALAAKALCEQTSVSIKGGVHVSPRAVETIVHCLRRPRDEVSKQVAVRLTTKPRKSEGRGSSLKNVVEIVFDSVISTRYSEDQRPRSTASGSFDAWVKKLPADQRAAVGRPKGSKGRPKN